MIYIIGLSILAIVIISALIISAKRDNQNKKALRELVNIKFITAK